MPGYSQLSKDCREVMKMSGRAGEGGRFAVDPEEEQEWRMMQLPNGSGWPWRWMKKEKQD